MLKEDMEEAAKEVAAMEEEVEAAHATTAVRLDTCQRIAPRNPSEEPATLADNKATPAATALNLLPNRGNGAKATRGTKRKI
jgi:hypothetical protein